MNKRCSKCSIKKNTNKFGKKSSCRNNIHNWCKVCRSNYDKNRFATLYNFNSYFKRSYQKSAKKYRDKLKKELVDNLGGKCTCCGEKEIIFLTLEHKNKDGAKHRKKVGSLIYLDVKRQGYPKSKYTILCWNCNTAIRGDKVCPHQM